MSCTYIHYSTPGWEFPVVSAPGSTAVTANPCGAPVFVYTTILCGPGTNDKSRPGAPKCISTGPVYEKNKKVYELVCATSPAAEQATKEHKFVQPPVPRVDRDP